MSVPEYGDLGKKAREVFRSGYAYELGKAKWVVPPIHEIGIEGDASVDLKSFKTGGSILAKYNAESYGKFSAKVSSDGPIVGEYSLNGVISENIDISAGYSYNLADSFHSGGFTGKFHNDMLHAKCTLTKDSDRSPDLLGSLVLKFGNFLVGYQSGFATNNSTITKNDIALAVDHGGVGLHIRCIQIPREYGLSAFHKVNDNLDVAMDAKIASNEDTRLWFLGAGFAYKVDDQCKLRMKLDKNSHLGTSVQLQLQERLKLTLAFSLDLLNLSNGQHKVGFGLDIGS